MSSRISSLCVAGLLSLAILSGCPTRSAPGAIADGAGASTSPPQDVDASIEAATTNVTLPDDAGDAATEAASDAASDDATIDADPGVPPEQAKLPPPTLADVGASCTVNARCATGSCVDGVCCASAACGGCQSCAVAGSLGACSPLPKLTEDPRSSCVGTMACDGAGHCAEANGNACHSTPDCLSGFCVDGVCCESACDQTCFSCNTVFALRGTCQALTGGTDEAAAAPCAGAQSCAPGPTATQPLCLLNDGQPCATPSDCVSGQCSTFYADRDGDKFGNPDSSISICGASDAPPTGYVADSSDCCDADGRAHPNQFSSFVAPDACGSWDYSCDGYLEKQFTSGPCGGYSAGVPADCGKTCVGVVLGTPLVRYTQACR